MYDHYDNSWSLELAISYINYVINNVEACADQAAKDNFIADSFGLYALLDDLNTMKVKLYEYSGSLNIKTKNIN